MKRDEMTKIVVHELEHIPRDVRGSEQNMLRAFYNARRRHDLALPKPMGRKSVLEWSVARLKQTWPDYEFRYGKSFFA